MMRRDYLLESLFLSGKLSKSRECVIQLHIGGLIGSSHVKKMEKWLLNIIRFLIQNLEILDSFYAS